MEIFTYEDYLRYKYLFEDLFEIWDELEKEKQNKICNTLMENNEKYILDYNNEKSNNKINNEHDKIFRILLDKKIDVAKFINKILKQDINAEKLEKYNSSFINRKFENREADVVYKIKNKNIFFLIEHQTKIDYLMSFRLLEYSVEIIRSTIDKINLINKTFETPCVIPIVLYTGKQKWDANKYIKTCQTKFKGLDIVIGKYNLIDINNFSNDELLEDGTFITKMMLVEKAKNSQELIQYLEDITEIIKEEDKENFISFINIILKDKIGEGVATKLLNKLYKKGDDNMSLAVVEMLQRETDMYIDIGRKEGKIQQLKEIIKKMMAENLSYDTIAKVTGIKKEEIEKFK